ncbi:HAD-IIIA family hydrolase [Candidatus Kapabacteria bacterium]|nr:HAD-IIIA family hydrolase [Candidatus Kapabacteria bacterium]
MRKCIFFDRDGIVNRRIVGDYVKNINEFEFIPEFFQIIKTISPEYSKIIITNQQGVGKKLMTLQDLHSVHNYMQINLLRKTYTSFDDILFCADLKESNSPRRKPNPGMLLEAIEKWEIDISNSYMIGDSKSDILAGERAGVKTIFISEEKFTNDDLKQMKLPNFHFKNHQEFILNPPF